jgi:hypothetical protein
MTSFVRARVSFAAIALALAFSASASAQEAGAATEALLKEAKFDYKVIKPGLFRVVLETPEGVSVVVVEELKLGWKDSKGSDVMRVAVFTQVMTTPAEFKPNVAMLTHITELNERIRFGSISTAKDKDGTKYYRNGSLFLKNLDSEQLANLIALCHYERFEIAKQLKAFVDEK